MKKVFVFGTGRCGTVSFNKLMGSIPGVFSMHEGIFDINGEQVRIGDMKEIGKLIYYKGEPDKNFKQAHSLNGEILKAMNKSFKTRKEMINDYEGKYDVFCDINPYSHCFIEYIYNKYPDAYFVHLIRNGYDVVNSYHLREKTTYPENIAEENYRGYQSGKPRPLKKDRWSKDWDKFDRVQKISWFWQNVNIQIENSMMAIPDSQRFLFKLEDMTVENFGLLMDQMNIDRSFDSRIITKKYNSSNTKLNWTKENIIKFNRIAASTMRHFEYEVKY